MRAEEHEPHRRLGLRASWHHTTKPGSSADRVYAAVVQRMRMFLFGEICSAQAPGRRWAKNQKGLLVEQGPGAGGGCQPFANERGSDAHHGVGARLRVIGGVTEQKSAEAVVVVGVFTREAAAKGRTWTQGGAVDSSCMECTRPGEPCAGAGPRSQPCSCTCVAHARRRVVHVHEPPGADPHAGWCGGWGRKSPGYPIINFFLREGTAP